MRSQRGYSKLLEEETGYAYTNTRARVMKTKLLTTDDYQKLMKMSINEITRFLEETEYKKEIDELATEFSGINLIEYGLIKNMENTLKKVFDMSIKGAHSQIVIYFRKWDIWNIKTILRGKLANASDEEILNNLIVVGELNKEFLEKIVKEAQNIEQAIEYFKGSEYYQILKENEDNIAGMEDELDKKYYADMLKLSQDELRKFVEMEIAIVNALNTLRAEKADIKLELIPGSKKAIKIPDDEEDKRAYLHTKLMKYGKQLMYGYKSNIGPLLGYLVAKENEIKNLRLIIRGKHSELPLELIEKNLVL